LIIFQILIEESTKLKIFWGVGLCSWISRYKYFSENFFLKIFSTLKISSTLKVEAAYTF
jgi:hypothetical protein